MKIDDPNLKIYGPSPNPGEPAVLIDRRDFFGDEDVARIVENKAKKGLRSEKIAKDLDVPIDWVMEARKGNGVPTKDERIELEKDKEKDT